MIITTTDLIADTRRQISEIEALELHRTPGPGMTVIDVREPAEFACGHLPGAVNIPRGVLEFEIATHPAIASAVAACAALHDRPLVLYCRSGGRSALAALSLQRMGFGAVRSLGGGIMAWCDAGLPTESC